MDRRSVLKNLSFALSGSIALPAWCKGWNAQSFNQTYFTGNFDDKLLAEIAETIIPETNTSGAKSLIINQFISRMVYDCYSKEVQQLFEKGLIDIEKQANKTFSKNFESCNAAQRMQLLDLFYKNDEASKKFITIVKNLTVQAYTNSEYYMVNVLKYEMAPGYYHGCVPVS
jgi:Gluconate 2-dehydrogenase subunit 3